MSDFDELKLTQYFKQLDDAGERFVSTIEAASRTLVADLEGIETAFEDANFPPQVKSVVALKVNSIGEAVEKAIDRVIADAGSD